MAIGEGQQASEGRKGLDLAFVLPMPAATPYGICWILIGNGRRWHQYTVGRGFLGHTDPPVRSKYRGPLCIETQPLNVYGRVFTVLRGVPGGGPVKEVVAVWVWSSNDSMHPSACRANTDSQSGRGPTDRSITHGQKVCGNLLYTENKLSPLWLCPLDGLLGTAKSVREVVSRLTADTQAVG